LDHRIISTSLSSSRYEATVVYTEPHLPSPRVHVRVLAYITKPEDRTSMLSNEFTLSFGARPSSSSSSSSPSSFVLPELSAVRSISGTCRRSSTAVNKGDLDGAAVVRHVIPTTVAAAECQLQVMDDIESVRPATSFLLTHCLVFSMGGCVKSATRRFAMTDSS
jgi:hypothetical protein